MCGMQQSLMWKNPWTSEGRVLVESAVLNAITPYRQNQQEKTEAGGILLGFRRGPHLHITTATVPQPSDQRRRFFFFRSPSHHQQVALRKWEATDHTTDYLGEWHTHPQCSPNPSHLDFSEWRKICAPRPAPMVFMILGWSGELWIGVSGREIARCDQIL